MLGWAWPMGIMEGTSATTINPLGTITRAEVAAMLARFDRDVLGGTESVVPPTSVPQPDPEPDSSILPDGKVLTEENVQAAIKALRETYPSRTPYPAPYRPNNSATATIVLAGQCCALTRLLTICRGDTR